MSRQTVPPDDSELRETLRAMAEADASLTTPSRVEASLMEAWDARGPSVPSRSRARGVTWTIMAVAASLVVAMVLQERGAPRASRPITSPDEQTSSPSVEAQGKSPYEAIAWLDPDPASLQIVRLRVASATLAEQGYAVSDLDGDGSVEIEMIVGADGAARSVRINPVWSETVR